MTATRFTARVLLLIFLGSVSGCGEKISTMSGVVKYQDKPVVSGIVTVKDKSGQTRVGAIQNDGRYEIKDILAGPVTIAVESPDPSKPIDDVGEVSDGGPRPKSPPPGWRKLPQKYGSIETSGLNYELKKGPNGQDIELKD